MVGGLIVAPGFAARTTESGEPSTYFPIGYVDLRAPIIVQNKAALKAILGGTQQRLAVVLNDTGPTERRAIGTTTWHLHGR